MPSPGHNELMWCQISGSTYNSIVLYIICTTSYWSALKKKMKKRDLKYWPTVRSEFLVILWHISGSALAKVMACCMTTPSHYLNLHWLIISCVLWHLPESNFTRSSHEFNPKHVFGVYSQNYYHICQGPMNEITLMGIYHHDSGENSHRIMLGVVM